MRQERRKAQVVDGSVETPFSLRGDPWEAKKYGENLEANLQELYARIRRMAYRPAAARLVLIPKPDGRKRPIAISNFEDKRLSAKPLPIPAESWQLIQLTDPRLYCA